MNVTRERPAIEPTRRTSSSRRQHAQDWQRAFESVLQETDKHALFKRIEVAEAAILTRRYDLQNSWDQPGERDKIEDALAHLRFLKRQRLGLGGMEDDSDD